MNKKQKPAVNKKPIIVHLVSFGRILVADSDHPDSAVLFEHLSDKREENLYMGDTREFEALVKAHGWEMEIRKARKDEMEDEEIRI